MCGKFWKQSRLGPFSYLTEGNFTKVIRYSFFFFSPSLKSSSPNRYKVKTHHFYLNQRSTSFLSVKATPSPASLLLFQPLRKVFWTSVSFFLGMFAQGEAEAVESKLIFRFLKIISLQ